MGYSSFKIKCVITREFTENQRVLFDPNSIKLCHTSCSLELSIYAKDTASEKALA